MFRCWNFITDLRGVGECDGVGGRVAGLSISGEESVVITFTPPESTTGKCKT